MQTQISQEKVPTTRWGRDRRLAFIDFRLYWERTINRSQLMEFFGISQQQSSADLAAYLALAPGNLSYDKSRKCYVATGSFAPAIVQAEAQGFLDEMYGLATGSMRPESSFIGWRPPTQVLRYPARPINAETLIRLLWAIRNNEALQVIYQSMRRPMPTRRWIAPHALGSDGQRWHVRAWCFENRQFRDFVISRVQGVEATRQSEIDSQSDSAWHDSVNLVIRARRGLTPGQRAAIEGDYGMVKGKLVWTCRRALAYYAIRQLRLDTAETLSPIEQPIELENADELQEIIAEGYKRPDVMSPSSTPPERV